MREATRPEDLEGAKAVRRRVFVEEQGVSPEEEYDELDAAAIHAVALREGAVIGTARLVAAGPGQARIGRMAVDRPWRRQGVGGKLLAFLETSAREHGYSQVILHAQTAAQEFYHRHGYTPVGATFFEAGIEHILMSRKLVDSQ